MIRHGFWWLAWILLLAGPHMGCKTSHSPDHPLSKDAGVAAAVVPGFLTGPMGVLWTNANDFSAHLARLDKGVIPGSEPVAGNLFQQEGRLLYIPTGDPGPGANRWAGTFRFLWEVNASRGFVISEVLQGYASVQSAEQCQRPIFQPDSGIPAMEQIDQQACQVENARVASKSGSEFSFKVWRAPELGGMVLQVQPAGLTNIAPIRLTDVVVEPQPPSLFEVPAEYRRFGSPEAMVQEIIRGQMLSRFRPGFGEESEGSRRRH